MIEISEISNAVKRTEKSIKVVITVPVLMLETADDTGIRS